MKINFQNMVYGLANLEANPLADVAARVNPILDIVCRYYHSNQVDFNQFTMEDLNLAIDEVLEYDPENWEENHPSHPVKVFMRTGELQENLLKIKPAEGDSIAFL